MIKKLSLIAGIFFFISCSFAMEEEVIPEGVCCICEDKIPDVLNTQRMTFCCNHNCHQSCILSSFDRDGILNCPICNTKITEDVFEDVEDEETEKNSASTTTSNTNNPLLTRNKKAASKKKDCLLL